MGGVELKHDFTFDEALGKAKFFDVEMRLHDADKPSSTMFYLWEKPGGTLVWMDVVMDFDIAQQMVSQCFNVGLGVLPLTSSVKEFFIFQHYAELPDNERQDWLRCMMTLLFTEVEPA